MKKLCVLCLLLVIIISCKNDDSEINPVIENKILLLKIDLETYVFEEGKELAFETNKEYDITTKYIEPGDIGSITLLYKDTEEKMFSGSIIWNGKGAIEYPKNFIKGNDFETMNTALPMPDIHVFKSIKYLIEPAYYMDTIEYQKIWESIDDLVLVKKYRENNPNAKIQLLLYTPAVGVFDPATADWIVILKN